MTDKKKHGWVSLAVLEGVTLGCGGLISFAIRDRFAFYNELAKPPFAPPGIVFPIAWTLLYAAMALSAWLVWRRGGPDRKLLLGLYFAQLAVNLLWPVIFFAYNALGLAFVWLVLLWGLIVAMTFSFSRHSRSAVWLLAPYLAWVSFAGVLNFVIARLNP